MLADFLRALPDQPRRVFLLDGCGALLTLAGVVLVLGPFEPHFGVPPTALRPLALGAGALAAYSFGCGAAFPLFAARAWPFLVGLALGNTLYGAATWVVLFTLRAQVTPLALAWFGAETVVLALVVAVELATARRQGAGA
ncbi:MAG TPA: hypothetical protein VGD87_02990 [Archangium sp.]